MTTYQEIIDSIRYRDAVLEREKEVVLSVIRQKRMDLFRNNSNNRQRDLNQIKISEKRLADINSILEFSKRKIEELEQKIANNAAPKIEEQKPIPKPEAKTAYEPKKEPNQNNKLKESKKDYSSLSEYAKAQGYESNQAEVDELIKDAENDFAVREDKRKHRMKVQNQMESDILKSIVDDISDVTAYIDNIDKTYSSKNNKIINVLENFKRKQKKLAKLISQKSITDASSIALDKETEKGSKNISLIEGGSENTNGKPKTQSIKVRYENNDGKQIPVIDFEQVAKVILNQGTTVNQKGTKEKERKERLKEGEKTNLQITTHFNISDLESFDIVPANLIQNAIELLQNLQVLRDACGLPITITSGYRSPERNKIAGGAVASQHMSANAADIQINGMTPKEVGNLIENLIKEGKMKEGGLGVYPRQNGWVHYDTRGTRIRWRS
jgi:uncharacterized protein YcbK (DUF882 family)